MNGFVSTRISASAGSGKTYQLVLRAIALLALGVPAERMIALTFTRKAAGEFASRILQRLADAAACDDAARDLTNDLSLTIAGNELRPGLVDRPEVVSLPFGRSDYLRLLRHVADRLGRLNMSTLDSFFSRMLQVLKLDLGMSEIAIASEEEMKRSREEVLRDIYAASLPDARGRGDLIELFKRATIGRESDRLDEELRELVNNFHEDYLNAWEAQRWGNASAIWENAAPWWHDAMEWQEAVGFANALTDDALFDDLVPAPTDKRVRENLVKLRDAMVNGLVLSWPKYATGLFFQSLRSGSGELNTYSKDYTLSGSWARGLGELAAAMMKRRVGYALERTRGMYGLINAFEQSYDRHVRRKGRLVFSDVARLLLPESGPGLTENPSFVMSLDELRFRMDGWFDHWMLDEFQDTSVVQWHLVEPFLDEAAQDSDANRSIFIVGDTKQSIYQWRGGTPRIFESLMNPDTVWGRIFRPWDMDVSYRSAPVVLEMVNAICHFDVTAPMAHLQARKRWVFSDHTSAGDASSMTGYAEIRQIPKHDVDDDDDAFGTAEQQAVTSLIKSVNPLERNLTCAVLVSENSHAKAMKAWLSSEEGGRIPAHVETDVPVGLDSAIGSALADLFLWIHHPGDAFAWNHLRVSPLGACLGVGDPGVLWPVWRQTWDKLGASGVLQRLENQIRASNPSLLTEFQVDRLAEWKRTAFDFDRTGGTPDDWLAVVASMKRSEHSRPDSVQVMTWHKAKGLEFDMLILPMGSIKKFDHAGHFNKLKKENQWGEASGIILSPGKDVIALDECLSQLKCEWEVERQFEGFCELYVALTRARRSLHILVPPPAKTPVCSPSGIIHAACMQQDSPVSSRTGDVLLSFGERTWYLQHGMARSPGTQGMQGSARRLPDPVFSSRIVPSRLEDHGDGYLPASPDAVLLGDEVHHLLQEMDWWNNAAADAMEGASEQAVELIRRALASPSVKRWLIYPDTAGEVLLWKERQVAGTIDGTYVSGVVDRVMLHDGRLTIIDYKTDRIDDMEALKKRHQGQLQCYRNLLSRSLGIPERDVVCVLVSLRLADSITC